MFLKVHVFLKSKTYYYSLDRPVTLNDIPGISSEDVLTELELLRYVARLVWSQ